MLETVDNIKPESIRDIASRRQDGYWAAPWTARPQAAPPGAVCGLPGTADRSRSIDLAQRAWGGLAHSDAKAFFAAYTKELYRFDQLCRHFCEFADYAESRDWDILKSRCASQVEQVYSNGFVAELALQWNKHLESVVCLGCGGSKDQSTKLP